MFDCRKKLLATAGQYQSIILINNTLEYKQNDGDTSMPVLELYVDPSVTNLHGRALNGDQTS